MIFVRPLARSSCNHLFSKGSVNNCTCLMHRLTARLFLVLLLVSVFAPSALAVAAPAPHACCLRMKHDCTETSHGPQFQALPTCCNRDCCRPLLSSQWVGNPQPRIVYVTPVSSPLSSSLLSVHHSDARSTSHSGRAPPQFSFFA